MKSKAETFKGTNDFQIIRKSYLAAQRIMVSIDSLTSVLYFVLLVSNTENPALTDYRYF